MSDKVILKLTLHDLMVIKFSVESQLAKKVYSYIYTNRTGGSSTVPTVTATLNYMATEHINVYKIHRCLRDRIGSTHASYTEDLVMNYYYKCIETMKWRERHPAEAARNEQQRLNEIHGRTGRSVFIPASEEIEW